MLPDAGVAGDARGGRGASVRRLEQLRGDWAEMRVLQWFRGVCPQVSVPKFPSFFALPTIVDKLQDDAKKIGGDNSYQINIGV